MPIRIYALAKELNIENKDVMDACNKVGIPGKGSALASLSDDEESRVRGHISGDGGGGAVAKEEAKPKEPERPSRDVPRAKSSIKTIVAPTKSRDAAEEPEAEVEDTSPAIESLPEIPSSTEPEPAVEQEPEPVAEKEPPAEPEEETPTKSAPLSKFTGRDDAAMRPAPPAPIRGERLNAGGKIRVLGKPKAKDEGKTSKADKGGKSSAPVIRLAAAPATPEPKQTPKKDEKSAQTPVIRLPRDTIQKTREGEAAPLKKFTDSHRDNDRGKRSTYDEKAESPLGKHRKPGREDGAKVDSSLGSTRRSRKPKRQRPGHSHSNHRRRGRRGAVKNTAAPRKDARVLQLPCTVRSFSEATGVPSGELLRTLMGLGVMANINAELGEDVVEALVDDFDVDIEIRGEETVEDELLNKFADVEDDPDSLVTRAPVVTFLGHVDHGKTSLLDYLIGANVVDGEAGGITQHIRAYEIFKNDKKISFVDTPGHEAFTEMRARGANVTDIAVLVVAADDGVMPQTEEAIIHAKAAGVPIVVAMNKMDLPGADANKVMQELASHELLPSEWGGDIEVVPTSAITGEGMDDLLDVLLTISELHEYKANPERTALGVCLEAEQESDRGVMAKLIVQNGTLKVGDVVVCGSTFGRVKAMFETLNPRKRLESAGPSTPVNVTGFDSPPGAGDSFLVVDDIAKARELAEMREDQGRAGRLSGNTVKVSFDDFQDRLMSGNLVSAMDEVVNLNLIIRADTRGSAEAIEKELTKLDHPEVQVKVLQSTVGGVSEADVWLAHASEAVIVAFNVIPDEKARSLADERNVEVRRYDIIYKLTDDIRAILEGKLKPEERVVELGAAVVLDTFSISRVGAIAGCRVMRGTIERGCRIRVNRDNVTIGDYELDSLRHHKDDVKDVRQGMECGIKLKGFNDVKLNDLLEAYKIEEVRRTL